MLMIREALARAHDEQGATAVEYAIMVALIAAVIIAAVTILGNEARDCFEAVGGAIPSGGSGSVC